MPLNAYLPMWRSIVKKRANRLKCVKFDGKSSKWHEFIGTLPYIVVKFFLRRKREINCSCTSFPFYFHFPLCFDQWKHTLTVWHTIHTRSRSWKVLIFFDFFVSGVTPTWFPFKCAWNHQFIYWINAKRKRQLLCCVWYFFGWAKRKFLQKKFAKNILFTKHTRARIKKNTEMQN